MSVVGFIFARGGSKGLPGKNIRPFCGKPLIAWSIEQAQNVKRIERLIVSTDSEEIASVATSYGAEVPFLRPAELAADDAPEWLAWRHALKYLKHTTGKIPDIMVSIPVTAPLRKSQDIEDCINEYQLGGGDVVIGVTESHRSPFFNMVKRKEDGTVELVIPPKSSIFRRQDAPTVYDITTICYVLSSKFVLQNDSIFNGCVKAVVIPAERAIDIDTLLDFKIAEFLHNFSQASA